MGGEEPRVGHVLLDAGERNRQVLADFLVVVDADDGDLVRNGKAEIAAGIVDAAGRPVAGDEDAHGTGKAFERQEKGSLGSLRRLDIADQDGLDDAL